MRAIFVLFRSLVIWPVLTFVVMASILSAVDAGELPSVSPEEARFRRPVAIARLDENTAVVANRCGTLSVIDLDHWSVAAEYRVGTRLTDVAAANGRILVTDAAESRLNLIKVDRNHAEVVSQIPLPAYPVTIQVAADQKSCSVACRWARKLTFVTIGETLDAAGDVDLEFCPGEQLHIPSRKRMLVADAFGGQLAVVNSSTRTVEAVHEFGAHNIRGLAISHDGQSLLISHQILNDAAFPRRSDIIWGVMIDNKIRVAEIDRVLAGEPNAVYRGRSFNVGYAGQGAGDPDALYVDPTGRAVLALAGVNEVSIGVPDSRAFQRIGVGIRPTALLPLTSDRFVVVNELSDSLTLIDMSRDASGRMFADEETGEKVVSESGSPERAADSKASLRGDGDKSYEAGSNGTYSYDADAGTYGRAYLDVDIYRSHLALGKTPEPGPVERGEQLFFSARLSHANWFSCHSCHVDGHTNGGRSDTFGDDTRGAPKRVLSLLGVSETGPWGWNGKKATLPKQIHQSARSTMSGRGVSDRETEDIAAFLKTLEPPPPFQPASTPADQKLVKAGRKLFESLRCTDCHAGSVLTSADAYDVGLEDERGLREFNPPTLRGVGYRPNLFHDRRASSLKEVLTKFQHQLDRPLRQDELTALLRYLRSL